MGKKLAIVAVAFLLGGCAGAAVIQNRQAEDAKAKVEINNALAVLKRQCEAELAVPEIDPIRSKIELWRDQNSVTPLPMLVDETYATDAERAALLTWTKVRESCQVRFRGYLDTSPLPPSMAQDLKDEFHAGILGFQAQAAQGVNFLVAGLYEGQFTYAQFNKKRAEFDAGMLQAINRFTVALDAKDRQQVAAQALAAQQQADAIVGAAKLVACASSHGKAAQILCQ